MGFSPPQKKPKTFTTSAWGGGGGPAVLEPRVGCPWKVELIFQGWVPPWIFTKGSSLKDSQDLPPLENQPFFRGDTSSNGWFSHISHVRFPGV